MSDHLTEIMEELSEKSPFVCKSCGHPAAIHKTTPQKPDRTITDYHDRFSKAVSEEADKSTFVCNSCGLHQAISKSNLH